MKLNQKRKPDTRKLVIIIGMLLVLFTFTLSMIPRSPTSAATATPTAKGKKCKYYYKVQPGDTIIYIGQLFQYDWREIAKANDLKEPYVLTPGQKLCIPGGVAPSSVAATGTGQTLTAKSAPTGTVVGGFNHVYIKLQNFPKNRPYNVLLRPRNGFVSYKINCFTINFPASFNRASEFQCRSIHTDNKGFFEGWLLIPNYIPKAATHELCVKDVWTDDTLCTDFTDPEYHLEVKALLTDKLGR